MLVTRNNADFHGVTFRYEKDSEGDHNIVAEHPLESEPIGYLTWADRDYDEGAERGEIMDVHTAPEHQRKGVATGMLKYAQSIAGGDIPTPRHAKSRTTSGEAWAKKVGGYFPPDEIVRY